MPTLHDSPEGTTHSYGDGCGDPAHNPWWYGIAAQAFSRGTLEQCLSKMEVIIEEAERRTLARPMGVSEWNQHGKKFGYWEYFEKLHLEAITLDEYKKRRALNRALDGKVVIDMETAKTASNELLWIANRREDFILRAVAEVIEKAILSASHPSTLCPHCHNPMKIEDGNSYVCPCNPETRITIG